MTVAAYNVVINPEVYGRLTAELESAFVNPDDPLDYLTLEKLPYLASGSSLSYHRYLTLNQTGVIKEGLR